MCDGCVCGGKRENRFHGSSIIAIGFGIAQVTKDGAIVYDEMDCERKHIAEKGEDTTEWPPFWTGQDAENAALADPDHKWEIIIHGPMNGATWERKSPGVWLQTESNRGFA